MYMYTLDAVLYTVQKWVWSITAFALSVNKDKGSKCIYQRISIKNDSHNDNAEISDVFSSSTLAVLREE